MVHLVLDADRQQAGRLEREQLTIAAECLDDNVLGAFDLFEDAGHRQAPLLVELLTIGPTDHRIDQRDELIATVGHVNDDDPLVYIALRCCQPDTWRGIHGLSQVVDEPADGIVYRRNRCGNGVQPRVGVFKDVENGHVRVRCVGKPGFRRICLLSGDYIAALHTAGAGSARPSLRRMSPSLLDDAATERRAAWLDGAPGRRVLRLGEAGYPELLARIARPPAELFVEGRTDLLHGPALAVVGSRHPTPAGRENAEAFSAALSAAGITVVSGLARGIDAAAHRGALSGIGSTVAVLGVGPDRVYPPSHRDLQQTIARSGCVISEFPPGMAALPGNFPRRNRIIAGLSLGCLVVEATLDSGSLKTARDALDEGREVFAIPGSIHAPQSRGCHALIRQGAALVESLADLLPALGQLAPPAAREPSPPADNSHPLLDALGDAPCSLDQLLRRCPQEAGAAMATLTELELAGSVARTSDGRFQRLWLSRPRQGD